MSRREAVLTAALLSALPIMLRVADQRGWDARMALLPACVGTGVCLILLALRDRVPAAAARWTAVLLLFATPLFGASVSDTDARRVLPFLLASAVLWLASADRGPRGRWRDAALVSVLLLADLWPALPARLRLPDVAALLFSGRGGLLFGSPVLWLGLVGWGGLDGRGRPRARVLIAALVALLVVGAATGQQGDQLTAALPLLAVGLAGALATLLRVAARRPGLVLAAGGLVLVGWNLLFMEQFRRGQLPRDATIAFPVVAAQSATLVSDAVGSPVAWPANWVFAARTGLPASRYDALAGRVLLANGPVGVIEVGALGDDDPDRALLDGRWGVRRPCPGSSPALCRELLGPARVLLPLGPPRDLDLTVRAAGEGALSLALNGRPAGGWTLTPEPRELALRVPAALWRDGMNEAALAGPAGATVARVVLRDPAGAPR